MELDERPFEYPRSGWSYEIKYDGYRILASTGPGAQLKSRKGANATRWFPEIVAAVSKLPAGCILDGEAAVLDSVGRSDFDKLQARSHGGNLSSAAVAYCVFDQLVDRGSDIRSMTLAARKKRLQRLLRNPQPSMLFVQAVADGRWLYEQAVALQLEGVVAKRNAAPYLSGVRSVDWVKLKRPRAIPPGRFRRSRDTA